MTVEINITHRTNAVTVIPLVFVDASGNAIDWTGNTFEMDIKATPAGAAILTLVSDDGIAETDLSASTITVTIPHTANLTGGQTYVYDLLMISGGIPQTLAFGNVIAVDGVTEL